MSTRKLLIISPAFPPQLNGLGDYSVMLASELSKNNFDVFFTGLPQQEEVTLSNYFVFGKKKKIIDILHEVKCTYVYLNYSNYGFQKKGVPFNLLKQLKELRKNKIKIVTYFHELYATGKFWQSSFILSPLQRFIFKKIYKLSDAVFCSNERVLNIIKHKTKDKGSKAKNIGLFSNIPEPVVIEDWNKRENIAVVFGSYGKRKEVYEKVDELNAFIKQTNIDKIIDVGSGDFINLWKNINVEVITKGAISADEVAVIFLKSKFGLINYVDSLLGKSGIFSAYAAHGLVVVNFYNKKDNFLKDFQVNKYYLNTKNLSNNFSTISKDIVEWYGNRNLKAHTNHVINALIY